MEWEGETMATQSVFDGTKTPVMLTVTYSSSDRVGLEVTLTLRYGSGSGHSTSCLRFTSRNSDIFVWFRSSAVDRSSEEASVFVEKISMTNMVTTSWLRILINIKSTWGNSNSRNKMGWYIYVDGVVIYIRKLYIFFVCVKAPDLNMDKPYINN